MIVRDEDFGFVGRPAVTARPYHLPDALHSDADALRLTNADIPALPDFDVWAELQRATLALAFSESGDARDWLQARVEALAAERKRRAALAAKGGARRG